MSPGIWAYRSPPNNSLVFYYLWTITEACEPSFHEEFLSRSQVDML